MILDSQLTLTSPNITTRTSDGLAAGQYNSVDQIDLGSRRDIAEGYPLKVILRVNGAFAGGAGSSVAASLWTADDASLTNATFYQAFFSLSKDAGALAQNSTYETTLHAPSQTAGTTLRRYLFLRCNASGSTNDFTGTGNTLTMSIVLDTQDGRNYYASGFTA